MAEVKLVAEPGRTTGSSESRRLRSAGRIPGVVYGHGADAISVSVDGRELRHALSGGSGTNQLLELKIGSDTHLALARVLQRHPVRHTVMHVDFQIVRRDEVIAADVPIVLVGEAKAVELEQGMIEQPLALLTVKATPSQIPGSIEVDISELKVGEGIRVGDLKLPSGVITDVHDEEIVVIASVSRVVIELAEEEAAAEAEAEAAEAAATAESGEAAEGGEAAATAEGGSDTGGEA